MLNIFLNHLPIIFAVVAGVVWVKFENPNKPVVKSIVSLIKGIPSAVKYVFSKKTSVHNNVVCKQQGEEDEFTKIFPVGNVGLNFWRDRL